MLEKIKNVAHEIKTFFTVEYEVNPKFRLFVKSVIGLLVVGFVWSVLHNRF